MRANAGPDVTVDCASPGGTTVTLDGSASVGPNLKYHWFAPAVAFDDSTAMKPTGLFPPGTTIVTLEVASGAARTRDQVLVSVRDTVPPTLALKATPSELWPPSRQLRKVEVSVDVGDGCDPQPAVRLVSVTSSDPDTCRERWGEGRDIVGAEIGTDDRAFYLRAEPGSYGRERTYQACYEARDASGNASVQCVTIPVPRCCGRGPGHWEDEPVAEEPAEVTLAFAAAVRPNPARAGAWLELTLPESGLARVTIFDVAGKMVARPIDGWHPAGQTQEWLGGLAGPQVYWYRAEWQGRHLEGRFVLLR